LSQELQSQDTTAQVTYTVETLNTRGRSAGMSEAALVPRISTPAPPEDLRARVTPEGIVINFSGTGQRREDSRMSTVYRVFRRAPGADSDVSIGEVRPHPSTQAELRDPAIEWGETYRYRITPVVQIAREGQPPIQIEGEDSRLLEVLAEDRFPPAVPVGLQAVAFSFLTKTGPHQFPRVAVDLNWSPSLDQDVAGYNVWRREGSEWRKLNRDLVNTPAYRDQQVQAGTWEYSVSAVDLRGNESERSAIAMEEVRETSTHP
jgi:hypothetical protein